MHRFILIVIFISLSIMTFSQASNSSIPKDYMYGAWYDSTQIANGGSGFIFTPDSCCSLIVNGEITSCNIEKKIKVLYQVDYKTNPKQLDIKFVDITIDSVKGTIPIIFEIIDQNHIRIAMHKDVMNKRPVDFRAGADAEVLILIRHIEKKLPTGLR